MPVCVLDRRLWWLVLLSGRASPTTAAVELDRREDDRSEILGPAMVAISRGPAVGEMAFWSTRSNRVPRSRNLVLVSQGYLATFCRDADTDARYTRRRASETFR